MRSTARPTLTPPRQSLSTTLLVILVLLPTFSLAALGLRALDQEVSLQRLEASRLQAQKMERVAQSLQLEVVQALEQLESTVEGFDRRPSVLRDWVLSQGVADLVWRGDLAGERVFPPPSVAALPREQRLLARFSEGIESLQRQLSEQTPRLTRPLGPAGEQRLLHCWLHQQRYCLLLQPDWPKPLLLKAIAMESSASYRLAPVADTVADTATGPDQMAYPLDGLLGNWQLLYPRQRVAELNTLWPAYAAILLPLILLLLGLGLGLYLLHRQTQKESDQRGTFLKLLAHEFKTPLANLELYTELARQAQSPEEVGEHMTVMESEFARLRRLINNAIHAHSDAGHRVLSRQTLVLESFLQQLITPFQPRLQASHTALRLECQTEAPVTLPSQVLEAVVINLLDNLVKYAPGNPATLSCHLEDETLMLHYRDQGPGLPTKDHSRHHNRTAGFGLGLYVCQRLVDQVGGTFTIGPGPGLTIQVALPAQLAMPSDSDTGEDSGASAP
ncbi:sensor histidine kinase [Marinobacter zhejiangensis]|uniref:histidine kinase n=1 Tax=Marinobacter zhejiangensis TaxID=488535 RepID=A0A1I4T433_9GAMM|nr:HAMP domain-containing sensor histidine kinase [Marinobacter zhejiangensis]SFM71446.1 Signal transduction histidine kinase [Marinobacter zhejiangensis]